MKRDVLSWNSQGQKVFPKEIHCVENLTQNRLARIHFEWPMERSINDPTFFLYSSHTFSSLVNREQSVIKALFIHVFLHFLEHAIANSDRNHKYEENDQISQDQFRIRRDNIREKSRGDHVDFMSSANENE